MLPSPTRVLVLALILGLLYVQHHRDVIHDYTPSGAEYDLQPLAAPRLSGSLFLVFVRALESWGLGGVLIAQVRHDSVLALPKQTAALESYSHIAPTFTPMALMHGSTRRQHEQLQETAAPDALARLVQTRASAPAADFRFASIADYSAAYATRRTTPVQVVQRVLAAVQASDEAQPPLRAFIALHADDVLAQARESAKRWEQGTTRSVLDGVPVAVKDEFNVRGYVTTAGTSFLTETVEESDCAPVERLRAAGAIIFGKTNMHECGVGVTGMNPHYGPARNPYNKSHFSGGSSSGSAVVVGAGLVPVALGNDGGGSIRIPAGFCGAVGLKPTFGRVSEHGGFPLAWNLAHAGPIAATALDAAITYAVIAGRDERDLNTLHQPPPHLDGFNDIESLAGLRVGIYEPYFNDASAEVVAANARFLDSLKAAGATVVNVQLPHMAAMTRAHQISIVAEFASALSRFYADGKGPLFAYDTRVVIRLGQSLSSDDFIASARVRTAALRLFDKLFGTDYTGLRPAGKGKIDVMLTPATGVVAPAIPDDALSAGMLDATMTSEVMRFASLPNLTGHPAISFPVGYTDDSNLPIPGQLIAAHYDEALLLRLAHFAETQVTKARPEVFHNIVM